MFRIAALLCLISFSSAVPSLKHGGRINGGEDIPIEKVPYQISLQVNGVHNCGGSLVAPNYVITAAHCTDGIPEANLTIRAGTSIRETGGQVTGVKRNVVHPNWDSFAIQNDFAILELDDDLTLDDKVQIIALPSQFQSWPAGTEALASGWGIQSADSTGDAVNLQGVTLEIVDPEACRNIYGSTASDVVLCAGSESGEGVCSGDSGGPLQVDGILAGVVSFGGECGRAGYPGGFANVASYREYIEEVAGL